MYPPSKFPVTVFASAVAERQTTYAFFAKVKRNFSGVSFKNESSIFVLISCELSFSNP